MHIYYSLAQVNAGLIHLHQFISYTCLGICNFTIHLFGTIYFEYVTIFFGISILTNLIMQIFGYTLMIRPEI